MQIQHSWIQEGYIALFVTHGDFHEDNLPELQQAIFTYLDQAKDERVHLIFDVTEQSKPPDLKSMSNINIRTHPSLGWVVVAGNVNPIIRTLTTLIARLRNARFRIINTREEAISFLRAIDLKIPTQETRVK